MFSALQGLSGLLKGFRCVTGGLKGYQGAFMKHLRVLQEIFRRYKALQGSQGRFQCFRKFSGPVQGLGDVQGFEKSLNFLTPKKKP